MCLQPRSDWHVSKQRGFDLTRSGVAPAELWSTCHEITLENSSVSRTRGFPKNPVICFFCFNDLDTTSLYDFWHEIRFMLMLQEFPFPHAWAAARRRDNSFTARSTLKSYIYIFICTLPDLP